MNSKQKFSEKQKKKRLGEIRKNKDSLGGYDMKIIEYNNATDIIIEFQDEYKAKICTAYDTFLKGGIKNPYHKCIAGIGYIGEGKYKISSNNKHTKAYEYWYKMLQRCYDAYFLNEYPTYIDCYVCEEWHCFQNFGKWFEENYYEIPNEKMCLDKDILCKGNKIYSPENCIFVTNNINVLFCKRNKLRGEYPIGVYLDKERNKFMAQCSIFDKEKGKSKTKKLGRYDTIDEAFIAYKNFKENHIKQVADEYKELIPKELYEALYKYEVDIND